MRFGSLVPSRCLLPECMRRFFPPAVILNLFAAPRCDFSFRLVFCFRATGFPLFSLSGRSSSPGTFLRRQQGHQDVGLHARSDLDQGVIGNVLQQPLHLRAAYFLVGHLAATVEDHGLDFMAFTEKSDDLVLANLIVVLGRSRPEFYFLELRPLLMFALFVRFFVGLVKVLAIIGDLTNRRVSSW